MTNRKKFPGNLIYAYTFEQYSDDGLSSFFLWRKTGKLRGEKSFGKMWKGFLLTYAVTINYITTIAPIVYLLIFTLFPETSTTALLYMS